MPNRPSSSDVVVVGAGAVGLAVAWRAAQCGLRVTVLERAGKAGAGTSSVAAGMLAPISETIATELPLMRLGLESVNMYPQFVEELQAATGMDPGYLRCGTLLAARDGDEAESLARELELRQTLGLTVHRLLASEARRLEPALAPTLRLALEIPDDHAIDPRKLTAALAQALTAAGGELRLGAPVNGVTTSGDRITGVRLDDGSEVPAGNVVVAAGPWSSALDGIPDGATIPVHPIKGQILRLHDPAGTGLLTRVLENDWRLPGAAGRRSLRARRDDGGARLRHDRDRRWRVRPSAQRVRAAAVGHRIGDRRAVGRSAPGNARQRCRRSARERSAGFTGRSATTATGSCSRRSRRSSWSRRWSVTGRRPGRVRADAVRRRRGGDGVTMNVTINGDRRELPAGATVASVIESFPGAPGGRGVAVAVEGEVVPRAQWPTRRAARRRQG